MPAWGAKDTLYIDREGGRYVAFVYSDGAKIQIKASTSKGEIESYARRKGFEIVWINPMSATKTKRRITKPPSAKQLAARAKFVKMVRAKNVSKKIGSPVGVTTAQMKAYDAGFRDLGRLASQHGTVNIAPPPGLVSQHGYEKFYRQGWSDAKIGESGRHRYKKNPARRRNKTIITKPKRVIVLNPLKMKPHEERYYKDMLRYYRGGIVVPPSLGNMTNYGVTYGRAQKINALAKSDAGKAQNPKSTRRKYRNGYLDLVIMGHAKKTPSGWVLGGKTFKQGKGIVPASRKGYYLDKATGTVFSKKARNSSSTSSDVRSPTSTKTSTRALTSGNVTVTGGAGAGANTNVRIYAAKTKGQKRAMNPQDLYVVTFTRKDGPTSIHRTVDAYAKSKPEAIRKIKEQILPRYPDAKGFTVSLVKSRTQRKRNLDHRDAAHPIEVSRYWQGRKGYLTPWQRAHKAGQQGLFEHGIKSRNPSRRTQTRPGAFPGDTWEGGRSLQWTNNRGKAISFSAASKLFYAGQRVGYHKGGKVLYVRSSEAKRNPSVKEIRKTFAGTVGKTQSVFAPIGTPKNVAKLGTLKLIDTETAKITPRGTVYLCADTKGKLHIVGSKNAPIYDGPAQSFGRINLIEYDSAKPHLYPGQGTIRFWHKLGEESGNKPTLVGDGKGGLKVKGGSYSITREGIRD